MSEPGIGELCEVMMRWPIITIKHKDNVKLDKLLHLHLHHTTAGQAQANEIAKLRPKS